MAQALPYTVNWFTLNTALPPPDCLQALAARGYRG